VSVPDPEAERAARLAKLESDLAYRVREVETLNGDVAELTEALRRRGDEVAGLNAKVAELDAALAARGSEVARLHAKLEELRAALETRGSEVEALSGGVEARVREAEELRRGLAARDEEVRTLNRKVRELALALEARGREIEALGGDAEPLAAAPATPPTAARPPATPPSSPPPPATAASTAVEGSWPRRPLGHLPGLAWTLVRTDFKVRYHGTLAGFLWALLKPLSLLGVLVAVFSWVFAAQPDYALNLVIGLLVWDFFAEGTRVGMTSLAGKGNLLAKTRFPRSLIVLTSGANSLLTMAVFATGVVAVLVATGRAPGVAALLLFGSYLVQLFLIVLGISLVGSVLFLRYRDLNQIWEVLLSAGFFLAPIVYPLGILPERFHFYLYVWPPTPVMQYARSVLLDGSAPSVQAHLLLFGVTLAILALGGLAFRALSPRAAEYL
jgi:lipopolysaccharide transport system permease protein